MLINVVLLLQHTFTSDGTLPFFRQGFKPKTDDFSIIGQEFSKLSLDKIEFKSVGEVPDGVIEAYLQPGIPGQHPPVQIRELGTAMGAVGGQDGIQAPGLQNYLPGVRPVGYEMPAFDMPAFEAPSFDGMKTRAELQAEMESMRAERIKDIEARRAEIKQVMDARRAERANSSKEI